MIKTDDNQVDRLTFWRNWYTAMRQLPDDLRLAWIDAVMDFAFAGKEPAPGDGVASAIGFQAVQMVRATIEISRKRKQSGSKGGACRKQSGSKTQAKRSKAEADRKQVQVQEQEQEHNANSITATTSKSPPTVDQFVDAGKLAGVPEEFSRQFYDGLVEAGWADAAGRYVGNWRRYLKTAWLDSQKKISAARAEIVDGIGGFRIAR